MGRDFGWLWAAYAASTVGTWFAFDAFTLVAILVLHSTPAEVSLLAAAGLIVGALLAVPLGPWIEFRRKRPVMIAMDLLRCGALLTLPAAYVLHGLTFGQLVVVSVVVAAADIVFTAASGAFLKSLVAKEDLLQANGRFEATQWSATAVGPPLGGAAIGASGPMTTIVVDAVSFLVSALGIRAIRRPEPAPAPAPALTVGEIFDGWRHILRHPVLRPLFLNSALFNGLLMATAPLLSVLMLGDLGFAPWQYGLAFGVPCLGGLVGSRLARPLVGRFGQGRVLLATSLLRVIWVPGLAFVTPGLPGLLLVMGLEFGIITCCSIYAPVSATARLENSAPDTVARVLSAWSVTTKVSIAATTAAWGLLAGAIGPREAIAVAGVLTLLTPATMLGRQSTRVAYGMISPQRTGTTRT
ncbi:MFS transporter [Kutzneria kofuensis]|uniref:Putative MFS family arabinose efflux permease n=1 Tax=Kutzneria kofuensis TaxID=103725 RepID=A0A7W9NEH1_9PSEU|nr:MFS transporter [Kutzneria kofuensis]MBB5889404.1 putative MFS family arabinose efflux permease [Kutzneria kofuensis]